MSKNRRANCHNKYQGSTKKVLCVCSAGLLRSPTAANVLHKEFGFNTRAVGIEADFALIPLDHVLIEWADEIVVMNSGHAEEVKNIAYEYGIENKLVVNLDIEDSFDYMDEQLQNLIKQRYAARGDI